MTSDSRTTTCVPWSWSFATSAAVTADFPDAGNPVIQRPNALCFSGFTVVVDLSGIESLPVEDRFHKVEQPGPNLWSQFGIPHRMRHHQTSTHQKRRGDLKNFGIVCCFQ